MGEPAEVEVFDRDGRAVARREPRRLPSLANPFNWLLLAAALVSAGAILVWAMAQVAINRLRGEG